MLDWVLNMPLTPKRSFQPAFICLKLAIEILEKQVKNECLKLKLKTPERRQLHHFGVFIVNFEHISHLFLVFLLFALNR